MEYSWLDTVEYPFTSRTHVVDGYRLHYIDEGNGPTLLFVHGTPSWSFDFRNVIKKLTAHYRCVAVDHIGFGLSEKPAAYPYSTLQHARNLEAFIRDLGLQQITLVVHDFGGPIGLHVALQHPEWFQRLVILNSWLWDNRKDPEFIQFSRMLRNPLLPVLYLLLNFSPRYILPASFGEKKLSKKLIRQFTSPFKTRAQRQGPLAFARSLLHDQEWFQTLWDQREKLANKPTLLIWGMKDPVLKPHLLEKFVAGFPAAQVIRLATSGHFPQEEQPNEVSDAIQTFLRQ